MALKTRHALAAAQQIWRLGSGKGTWKVGSYWEICYFDIHTLLMTRPPILWPMKIRGRVCVCHVSECVVFSKSADDLPLIQIDVHSTEQQNSRQMNVCPH